MACFYDTRLNNFEMYDDRLQNYFDQSLCHTQLSRLVVPSYIFL